MATNNTWRIENLKSILPPFLEIEKKDFFFFIIRKLESTSHTHLPKNLKFERHGICTEVEML